MKPNATSIAKIILLFLIICFNGHSQNIHKSERFNIQFRHSEKLVAYETEKDSVVGFENKNIAVDFEVVGLNKESEQFKSDLKKGAEEIGYDMGFAPLKDGGKCKNIDKSYYVIGNEVDDELNIKTPVIVLAIINETKQLAYEVTIYCYNNNENEGIEIAKSFEFIKP